MSIENIFKALEIVDSLSVDDFDKFKKHLEVVDSKFKKQSSVHRIRDIPPYNPMPLRIEINSLPPREIEPLPLRISSDKYDPTIPPPPKPQKNIDCICGRLFGLIPTHPDKCKCRGGK